MDRRALIRLRVAFLLLGAALLLPLGLLLRSVDARLEAQRRLRHELVAERIFDEMERELTSLLQRENTRPSAAYADSGTRVENWAPFVVGYFTRDAHSAQIIAKSQLAPERIQRLEAALNISQGSAQPSAAGASDSAPSGAQKRSLGAASQVLELDTGSGSDARSDKTKDARKLASPRAAAYEPAPTSKGDQLVEPVPAAAPNDSFVRRYGADDVLKQLNRAKEEREQAQKPVQLPAKRKAQSSSRAAPAEASSDDPLRGF